MKVREFFGMIGKAFVDLIRKPAVVIPGLVFFLFVFGFSELGGRVAYSLQTTPLNVAWVVFSVVFLLLLGGFISAGLIGMCLKAVKREKLGNSFLAAAKRFWFRNALVLFLFLIFFNLINLTLFVFTQLMIGLGSPVSVGVFQLLSILIAFAWVAAIIIFFTFSNFFVVAEDLGVRAGVRRSFGLVRKEYLATLSLSVILFALVFLVGEIQGIVGGLISYVIVLPLMFLIFTRFVVDFGK